MRRFAATTNALMWAIIGFGAGAVMMFWIFNAN
jgi:hypothetical protein